MQASILDLRYKMKDVLKALERNETVIILYHGKMKGKIIPCLSKSKPKVQSDPFFGSCKHEQDSVSNQMDKLRGSRYNDL